jgi:tetratricopeptide (TPR) repeat protein
MSVPKDHSDPGGRAEKIRAMVVDDYERISNTEGPFAILNLSRDASLDEVRSRYERYEKFYRAENFQRFADMDMTRKALDIRRAISRAMVSIESAAGSDSAVIPVSGTGAEPALPQVDDDCAALGDIYFRDGLTFLKLRDLNSAEECLQRAVDYDPSRGIILAYLGYTQFKLRANDPTVVEESRKRLKRAAKMQPDNVEVYVLMARFGINTDAIDFASHALDTVEQLRAKHPKLKKLKKRLARLN